MRIASVLVSILLMFLGTSIVAAEPISRPFLVSWSNVEAKLEGDFWEIHFSTPLNGVLAGRRGAIARTTDAGTSWYKTESGVEADLWSASFPEPAHGWIVGDSGTIIVTHDGGATWRQQNSRTKSSLVGVSFSNARQGWAIASDGKVIATSDGGETWERRWSETGTTFAAISFADYRTGWIVGGEGKIFRTRDGGVTWQRQESGTSQNLWSVQFSDLSNGWAIGESGTVLVTHDGGIQWLMQSSGTERDLSRVYFANSTTGWIVGDGGTILTTRDGGEHWRVQQSGTKRLLIGVHFADANSGWIVGFRGLILKAALIGVSPEVEEISTRSSGVLGELKVVLKLRGESEPTGVYLWARTGRAAWINLGEARPTSGAQWTYSWRPSQVGFRAGDEIEYKVQLEDAGPPAFVITGRFQFEPWWIRLWRDNKKIVAGILIATSALLLLFAATMALFVFAPASLAHIGALTQEKEKVEFKFNFGSLLSLGNRLLQEFLLPFLCRRSRVKKAWTAKYLDGRVKFSNLNSPARKIFFGDAGILDAWIVRVAEQIEVGLKEIEFFQQRGVYVEFPLNDSRGDCAIERPSPEAFRPVFRRTQTVISIVGVGGAGKSTLACALGRWVFDPDPLSRPVDHRMIPVLLAENTTNLLDSIAAYLRRMVDPEDVPVDLIRGLLAHKRLLVVVDALSERDAATQAHVEQFHKLPDRVGALVVTSRTEPEFGPIERTVLHPVKLDARRIVPFIISYLDRRETEGRLRDGRTQLVLGEKILALAEASGQRTPITALLVTLFVDSARTRVGDGRSLGDLPRAMPEIFIDYLRRLNTTTGTYVQKVTDPAFVEAAQIAATVSLGKNFVPGDFLASEVLEVLSKEGFESQAQLLLDQLVGAGVIERRAPGGYVLLRFSLDPAAEYLAAVRQIIKLRSADSKRWRGYLATLRKVDGYPSAIEGYLGAFANCYGSLRRELQLLEVSFPWEEDERPQQTPSHSSTFEQRLPY